jgi:hypothetical protein
MSVSRILTVIGALVLGTCASALAQGYPQGCYQNFQNYPCPPLPGQSCSVSAYQGQFTYYGGDAYSWTETTCCGRPLWVPISYESPCLNAGVRDPKSRTQLSKLASKKRVLMAGCDGYLRPVPQMQNQADTPRHEFTLPAHGAAPLFSRSGF